MDEILEPPKPKKTKQAKKGANVKDTDTGTGKELKAIWKAIDEIKTAIDCLVEAKANTTEKNLTTPARRQRQKTLWKPVKTLKIISNNNLKSN